MTTYQTQNAVLEGNRTKIALINKHLNAGRFKKVANILTHSKPKIRTAFFATLSGESLNDVLAEFPVLEPVGKSSDAGTVEARKRKWASDSEIRRIHIAEIQSHRDDLRWLALSKFSKVQLRQALTDDEIDKIDEINKSLVMSSEAAEMLGCSAYQFNKLVGQGDLKPVSHRTIHIGGKYVGARQWFRADVEAFLTTD